MDLTELRRFLHKSQSSVVALLDQDLLDFSRTIEMILDRALAATRDKENIVEAGSNRFPHDILDGWLVYDR